ncbi:hypothetical protein Dimus_009659, partial [Dionaea muscipula]
MTLRTSISSRKLKCTTTPSSSSQPEIAGDLPGLLHAGQRQDLPELPYAGKRQDLPGLHH